MVDIDTRAIAVRARYSTHPDYSWFSTVLPSLSIVLNGSFHWDRLYTLSIREGGPLLVDVSEVSAMLLRDRRSSNTPNKPYKFRGVVPHTILYCMRKHLFAQLHKCLV